MSREVMDKVVRRFIVLYGEPKDVEPKELFAEFFKALGSFRGDILTKGADEVIRNHTFPTWPTVGEVVKSCRAVAESLADRYVREEPPKTPPREPVSPKVAKALLEGFRHSMNSGNDFAGIRKRAHAWAKHHNCKVTMNVSAPWGEEVVDQYGRIVPIGWRTGDAA